MTSAQPVDAPLDGDAARRALIGVLQAAYSGELAAAYAYRGHWRSLWRTRRADQRTEIRRIEDAEWHHRRLVGVMLDELGSGPSGRRELLMGAIGRFFGGLCFVGGFFSPMYAAGRLEAVNVSQYEAAASHAIAAGLEHLLPALQAMVAEEVRHELFFADQVRGHPLLPLAARIGGWRPT